MRGCTADGTLNESAFSKPLPTIGLYIACASLCCAAGMAVDTIRGFRSRRLWFPCKYFTLNAATLTVLSVAIKLPLDFNTSMPGPIDQLSKLSSTALICTVMGNFMPSLGVTDNAASNIIALGILVVTVIVNVIIQMGTGVIYVHLPEHAVIVYFMLVLLILLISSALPLKTTKEHLEKLYDIKHRKIEDAGTGDKFDVTSFQELAKKYWLMAHTSSPQYVLGRSATCTASGAFCLLAALVLVEASVRTFVARRSGFCKGTSDYRWSIFLVYLSQSLAVAVGTVAPAFRWFTAISFRSPDTGRGSWTDEFKVEEYWVEGLKVLMEAPLSLQFRNRRCQKIIHNTKSMILRLLIKVQTGVVLASKVVRLVSILPVRWINHGTGLLRKMPSSVAAGSSNLQEFVLCLEGEEDLVKVITRNERKDTEKWIEKGRKKSPKNLISLIGERIPSARGAPCFTLVGRLDSDEVTSIAPGVQEYCWALPMVTLASIAMALAGDDQSSLKPLLSAVGEGLRYVKLIEKNLEAKGLLNQRRAADNLWSLLSLHNRWFDLDLRPLAAEAKSSREVVEQLKASGESCVRRFLKEKDGFDKTNCLEWPPEMLAANCMYRLVSTILEHCNRNPGIEGHIFLWVRALIADLLGACLTNLPAAIYMECFCSPIEVREESVRSAAFLLGEAEEIMTLLEDKEAARSYPEDKEYVDNWRLKRGGNSEWSLDNDLCLILGSSSNTMSASLSATSSNSMSGFTCDESVESIDPTQQPLPGQPEDMV